MVCLSVSHGLSDLSSTYCCCCCCCHPHSCPACTAIPSFRAPNACRNITVVSATGNSSSSNDALPVLDMQSRVGILQLCSTCTFSLFWLSVSNENPTGSGGGMTVFRGQQGSRVDWMGGASWRLACPPARSQLELLNLTQRSILFPSPPAGQLVKLVNVTYKIS